MQNQILDLVILDISMPVMNGVEVLRYLKKTGLKSFKILALTLYNEPIVVHQLLELGCDGYMPKNCDADDLIGVVSKVLAGKLSYPKEFDEKIMQLIQLKKIPTQILSVNEVEIIRLLSLGMNSKEIAVALKYTVRSIETKRLRLQKKLRVKSSIELISTAYKMGILKPDSN